MEQMNVRRNSCAFRNSHFDTIGGFSRTAEGFAALAHALYGSSENESPILVSWTNCNAVSPGLIHEHRSQASSFIQRTTFPLPMRRAKVSLSHSFQDSRSSLVFGVHPSALRRSGRFTNQKRSGNHFRTILNMPSSGQPIQISGVCF